MKINEISNCRICQNDDLQLIIDLGIQYLGGIFPKNKDEEVPKSPLVLVKCMDCGLVQLKHTCDLELMYGDNYGYRSGLNKSMILHLENKVKEILQIVDLKENELVIDIGSNDSTLLKNYSSNAELVGIDPSGEKFLKYYPEHVTLIPDFFSSKLIKEKTNKKAKIVTSISMFYDLENPVQFAKEIAEILDDEGIWVTEQSYLPLMLERNSYDTICHEHLEYYALKQIRWIAEEVGLKIVDVSFNDINGGSFSTILAKKNSAIKSNDELINQILDNEQKFDDLIPFVEFKKRIEAHKIEIQKFFTKAKEDNKIIIGYGASTKGNVLLQYCDISEKDMPFIAEVNEDKFGSYTPGTKIPIVSESEAKKLNPDYYFVLPWHFKKFIIEKEKIFLETGGKLLFPLPSQEIVEK